MEIRVLTEKDAAASRRLRLEGLRDNPTAFAASYDEERQLTVELVAGRLIRTEYGAVFGAFDQEALVGMVGIQRESRSKLRHKALIWGMYVTPNCRRRGVGSQLLSALLDHGNTAMPGLRQINLSVNATNVSAIEMFRKAGFEPFGVERAFLIADGVPHDLMHMVRFVTRA